MSNEFAAASAAFMSAYAPGASDAAPAADVAAVAAPAETVTADAPVVDAAPVGEAPAADAPPVEGEPQAEAPAEPPPVAEPMRPGIRAAQEYRREREELIRTNARLEAEQAMTQQAIMPLLQQLQSVQAEIAALRQGGLQPAAPAEPEFDDMGDPALRELYELKKELAEQKTWRQQFEAQRQHEATVAKHLSDYEQQWGQLKGQHAELRNPVAAKAFWDTVNANPHTPLDIVAGYIIARHPVAQNNPGANRPGGVPARPPVAAVAPNVPLKPPPPRPPLGGAAATVPVASRPTTFAEADAAFARSRAAGRV